MSRFVSCLVVALLCCATLAGADGLRGFTAEDLVQLDRVSSPAPSPDGRQVAFVLRSTDMEADRGRTDLWIIKADGTNQRRLTTDPAGDFSPIWAEDGKVLWFLSTRSGSSQIWRLDPSGGESQQLSDFPLDVGDIKLSPDGTQLAFSMEVFVDCETVDCTVERLAAEEDRVTTGVVYDQGFIRHWDQWNDGRRRHIFVAAVQGDGSLGDPVDFTQGLEADTPSKPWGGAEEFAFTPDGGLIFTARVAGASEPWSTNFDLYYVQKAGAEPVNLTADNLAWDTTPIFSPDGKSLVWLAMSTPGYEADRFRILRADWNGGTPGTPHEVAPDWDRSPASIAFSDNGKSLLVHANNIGRSVLFTIDANSGKVRELFANGKSGSEAEVGGRVFFSREAFETPADIWSVGMNGKGAKQLTHFNVERLAGIDLAGSEQFSFTGANDETVWAWMVKPANFDPAKRYPVAFLIHGGPQGSFGTGFHYRWNPQTYAGRGYASVMVDFHGSTGYGQEFCDSIQDNWGGWPLEDLQKGLAAALDRYEWMDGDRVVALGASYGGYMINWIAGNWPDRFRALVNHDGLFDTEFMYYSTEELWFPEREFLGPPYASRAAYDRWNPSLHVDKWKTPMLVVHGGHDYRVPLTQGLATFNALQRRGVPSRLLYYPEENHWVLKPHNSIQWHQTVLDWIDQWSAPNATSR